MAAVAKFSDPQDRSKLELPRTWTSLEARSREDAEESEDYVATYAPNATPLHRDAGSTRPPKKGATRLFMTATAGSVPF